MALQERVRRPRRRVGLAVAALTAASLALSGCSLFGEQKTEGGSGSGHITIQSVNFSHIDPQSVTAGMWFVQMGLLEGLVLQTPDGTDVRPAMAEKWEVSSDALTYTFHLREAKWSNGDPVTAEDFLWSYERLLSPDRGVGGTTTEAPSYQVALGIENAVDYSAGIVENFADVGVKAPDERTVVFTLAAPNPGFLMGLTHPSMLPLNPTAVDGGNWQKPESWVGNGPFNLSGWVANSSVALERNPEYWDVDNVGLESIDVELIEAGALTTTVPYENGDVDIQALTNAADVAKFMDDPAYADHIKILSSSATNFLTPLHSKNEILLDEDIRTAMNLAFGVARERIAGLSETTTAASTLVPPTVPGWSEKLASHKNMIGSGAADQARKLLADAGYPNGEGFPQLTILATHDFDQLDVIVDTLKTELGITMVKDVVEAGVYTERRALLHEADYLGYWHGTFAGLATWSAQANQLWAPAFMQQWSLSAEGYQKYLDVNGNKDLAPADRHTQISAVLAEYSTPEVQEFVKKAKDAGLITDTQDQQKALQDAVAVREKAQIVLPLAWNDTVMLAQPRVQGLVLRAQSDRYYFRDLSVTAED